MTPFISTAVLALPPIPTKWWGTVTYNGSLATEGVVRAYVNNTEIASTPVLATSLYALDVPCLSGDNVVLRVYDIPATGEMACSPGSPFLLDLVVSTLDNGGYCEYNKSCSSGECLNNFCSPWCGNNV